MDNDINILMPSPAMTHFTYDHIKELLKYIFRHPELLSSLQIALEDDDKTAILQQFDLKLSKILAEVVKNGKDKDQEHRKQKITNEFGSGDDMKLHNSYNIKEPSLKRDLSVKSNQKTCTQNCDKQISQESESVKICSDQLTITSYCAPNKRRKTQGNLRTYAKLPFFEIKCKTLTPCPVAIRNDPFGSVKTCINGDDAKIPKIPSELRKSDGKGKHKKIQRRKPTSTVIIKENGKSIKPLDLGEVSNDKSYTHTANDIGAESSSQESSLQSETKSKWTREEDRIILVYTQKYGTTFEAFENASESLENRSIAEVQQRFSEIMAILKTAMESGKLKKT